MGQNGGSRASGNKTSPRVIAARRRVEKALRLREAGASYAMIAEQCGYKNATRAHEAVKRAIQALPREAATDCRKFEEDRLDRLMLAYWKRAVDGNLDAADYILRLMKRRAALLGLDAPERFEDVTPPKGYQTGNAPEDI